MSLLSRSRTTVRAGRPAMATSIVRFADGWVEATIYRINVTACALSSRDRVTADDRPAGRWRHLA